MPLDVLVDGKQVAILGDEQVITFTLPETGGEVQVRMQNAAASPVLRVAPGSATVYLECGNRTWLLFDFLNLCYLPGVRDRVFFLREAGALKQEAHVA